MRSFVGLCTLVVTSAVWLHPAAAPVRLGAAAQLLVDDHVIESLDGFGRVFHQPERYSGNPILTGSEPWEKWLIELNGRSVVYDEQRSEFRMYYGANLPDAGAPTRTRYKVCLALSRDGLHWQRPNLGLVEWEGSRSNNILPWGQNWMRRPNVILDPRDPDPNRRYKMTYVDMIGGRTAITKGYSADGVRWRLNGDDKPWFRREHSANLLGWDASIGRYVIYPRISAATSGKEGPPASGSRVSAIGRSTSADFVTWSEVELVLAPGASDPGRDFTGLAAFTYEDLYLGWLWVFDRNKTAEAELASSRDGRNWQRVAPGQTFFPRGGAGTWDSEMILVVAPVVRDDKIWIYYSGWNTPYTTEAQEKLTRGWVENGRRMQWAIGLATLRLDGFASLDAGAAGGTLLTRPLQLDGGTLTVNARVVDELRVEVLADGRPLPGYTAAECLPLRGDGLRQPVRWKEHAGVDELRGRAVQLRFTLRDGSLYAFRCDPRARG